MTFNFLDIVFMALMLFTAVHGAVNGFIKEFFSKLALIGGVLLAVLFYAKLAPFINKQISSVFLSQILAFLLIFILVYLLIRLVQYFVGSFFSGDIFTGLDGALGFFLGIGEGLLLVCVVLVILYAQPWFQIAPLVKNSFFHSLLEGFLAKPLYSVKSFIGFTSFFSGGFAGV